VTIYHLYGGVLMGNQHKQVSKTKDQFRLIGMMIIAIVAIVGLSLRFDSPAFWAFLGLIATGLLR
jgi:hypothetical protein